MSDTRVIHSSEIADDPGGFAGDYVPLADYEADLKAVEAARQQAEKDRDAAKRRAEKFIQRRLNLLEVLAQAEAEVSDLRAQIARQLDNHHNALTCPYCNPDKRLLVDVDAVIQAIAELPDRTSPNDWPEAMLVTADELRAILAARVTPPQEAAK
jgi:hypothetical protein